MTKKPWLSEINISPEIVKKVIENQFPSIQVSTLSFLGEGWDNAVFLINDQYTFRFPRRKIALQLLEREKIILPHIHSRLNLQAPKPVFYGKPSKLFPWPFLGSTLVPGQCADKAYLNKTERRNAATTIALFLKNLHSFDKEEIRSLGIGQDILGEFNIRSKINQGLDNLKQIQSLGYTLNYSRLEKVLHSTDTDYRAPKETLVHGDFYVRHLIIDANKSITGIIDWGDIHIGDPAIDLSIAHSFLPPEAHQTFRDTYGDISEETWHFARFRAILLLTHLLLYANDNQATDLEQEILTSFGFITE